MNKYVTFQQIISYKINSVFSPFISSIPSSIHLLPYTYIVRNILKNALLKAIVKKIIPYCLLPIKEED